MKAIDAQFTVGRVNQRADNAVSLSLTTAAEVADADYPAFHALRYSEVRGVLAPKGAGPETPVADDVEWPEPDEKSTPSQRVRFWCGQAWEVLARQGRTGHTKEGYYRAEMEKVRRGFEQIAKS